MATYTIHIFTGTCLEITSQDVTVESETPLLAAITGLERLAVRSLEHVAGIEIRLISEALPAERRETSDGYHVRFQAST